MKKTIAVIFSAILFASVINATGCADSTEHVGHEISGIDSVSWSDRVIEFTAERPCFDGEFSDYRKIAEFISSETVGCNSYAAFIKYYRKGFSTYLFRELLSAESGIRTSCLDAVGYQKFYCIRKRYL